MEIAYKAKEYQAVSVRVDGRVVGSIVESKKGFRFHPSSFLYAKCGEFFPTFAECKSSLETGGLKLFFASSAEKTA